MVEPWAYTGLMRTGFLFGLMVLASPVFGQGSIFPDKAAKEAVKQIDPETVSSESRAFLKMKMKNHVKDMKDLSVAVATIKLADVERLAQGIANQPRLDPTAGPANHLPPQFFELQNLLKKTAQELADAGKANDMHASLEKYRELVGQCVSCHAVFRAQVQSPTKK